MEQENPSNLPQIILYNANALHLHSENLLRRHIEKMYFFARTRNYFPFGTGKNVLLYRESSPQSFNGSYTGNFYSRYIQSKTCLPYYSTYLFENQSLSLIDNKNLKYNFTHHKLTFRQRIEREMMFERFGIPMLAIHDITSSLPCEEFNHIGFPDCTHYCMPGMPDVWNQLLYNFVLNSPLIKS